MNGRVFIAAMLVGAGWLLRDALAKTDCRVRVALVIAGTIFAVLGCKAVLG